MTDFEIVEIGNEQRRHEAAIMAQEEAEAAQRQLQEEVHDIIDTHLVIAMLLNSIFPNNRERLPMPITPLPTTQDEENELDQELIAIQLSSSNDSMYSADSKPTSGSSCHGFLTVSEEGSNEETICEKKLIQVRNNDLDFLNLINHLNRKRNGNKNTVVSSVSPSYGNILNNDHFLCHICHFSSNTIDEWRYGTNEHPFIKNAGAMFQHLLRMHCNQRKGEQQLTGGAENYLASIVEDIKTRRPAPLLQRKTSLPKASSTSCLETAWRSNQPELTKESVNKYVFDDNFCKGHIKLVPIQGIEYWYDLANSVYCTCNGRVMNLTRSRTHLGPILILDQNLSIGPTPSFFNQTRRSVIQTH